jgi:hypothetical protein
MRSAMSEASVTACVRTSACRLARKVSRYRAAMPSIPIDRTIRATSTSTSVKPACDDGRATEE